MDSDGSDARILSDSADKKEVSDDMPYFSADGQWIYYVFYEDGKGSIRKISVNGGESKDRQSDG